MATEGFEPVDKVGEWAKPTGRWNEYTREPVRIIGAKRTPFIKQGYPGVRLYFRIVDAAGKQHTVFQHAVSIASDAK